MLIVKLTRRWFTANATCGEFCVYDGEREIFNCYTCEDAVRGDGDPATVAEWKIKGHTAIPYGTYTLRFTWSNKFRRMMWQICDVPEYIGIRIHAGNTAADTEGCPLVGEHIGGNYQSVVNSKIVLDRFEATMEKYGNKDAQIQILKGVA